MSLFYFTDFLKDTSLLIVIAYLLTRGRLLRLLFCKRLRLTETVLLGFSLSVISLIVSSLPDIGFRYPCQTLFVGFATLAGGLYVGLIVAAVSSLNTILTFPLHVIEMLLGVLMISPFAARLQRQNEVSLRLFFGFLAGALAQSCHTLLHNTLVGPWQVHSPPSIAWLSIPISGFGVAMLLLVVSDAQERADSGRRLLETQRQRAEAEHAQAVASEAQLAALRARIHPHFLFNALNSIAELCCIAPERAEVACLNLSQFMRRSLETSTARTTTLEEEITLVRAYLQIEQERLAERLSVIWQVDSGCGSLCLVPFSIQILVENAINHGLAQRVERGTLTVTVRRAHRHLLVAVRDDGVGMSAEDRRKVLKAQGSSTHGLKILDEQCRILYGTHSRLRLFSRENRGTLVVFAVPVETSRDEPARARVKEEK